MDDKRVNDLAQDVALPSLQNLARRNRVRVVIPPGVSLYATVQVRNRPLGTYRGVVTDVSAGGLAVHMIEAAISPPQEGDEVAVRFEHGGVPAQAVGHVVRSAVNDLSIRFSESAVSEVVNLSLLSLIVRIITRRVNYVSHAGVKLKHELLYHHFYGAGCLDIRVRRTKPAWWLLAFLEYFVSWSEEGGLATGVIDRFFAVEQEAVRNSGKKPAHAARAGTVNLIRHEAPLVPLQILAVKIIQRCQKYQPDHVADFTFMQSTLAVSNTGR